MRDGPGAIIARRTSLTGPPRRPAISQANSVGTLRRRRHCPRDQVPPMPLRLRRRTLGRRHAPLCLHPSIFVAAENILVDLTVGLAVLAETLKSAFSGLHHLDADATDVDVDADCADDSVVPAQIGSAVQLDRVTPI